MHKTTDKFQLFFVYLALTVITLGVFWQVRNFSFTNYDDDVYVTNNNHVLTGLTLNNVTWAFTGSHFFMWHPVTSLSHMLDCQLFGLKAGWHHLTNLIFHIANVLLLFTVLRRMTGAFWQSAFVAAVFALHPLNVESVAWVSERKSVLSGFFWLLTIAVYIRYTKYPRITNYLLVVLVFSLALMSKPTTVTLPFALLLLDYWPLRRFQWITQDLPTAGYKKLSTWQLVKEKIPLFILSTILCVITVATQESGNVLAPSKYFPFSVRLANALVSYVVYIGKMIYPACLAVFYPHPGFGLPLWKPVTAFIILAAVSACVIYLGSRKAYLIVGWLWFLGTLVPVIGLVQAGDQAMADRYAYIPLIGLFITVAWGLNDLSAKWNYRKITLWPLSVAIILVFTVLTWFQVGYWRDNISLFSHALKATIGNCLAYNSRGIAYGNKGAYDLAISDFNKAIEINPGYAKAYSNRGTTYYYKGEYDLAVSDQSRALEIDPRYAEAYCNRGIVYYLKGELDRAIADYNKALEINPGYFDACFNKALACEAAGRREEAVEAYKVLIQYAPPQYSLYMERIKQKIKELER